MNSVLNPEAPEFHPHMASTVQDGYLRVNKTVRASNTFPIGASYNIFKTFTDFNVVTCQISDNVVVQSNQIMVTELPAVKLKSNDEEYNTEKVIDANDTMIDKINIHIDTVDGVNQPSEKFLNGVRHVVNVSSWNSAPVIAKIQMGSTTFIGAKNIARPQLSFKDPIDNSESLWVPKISDKPNNIKPLALNILYNEEGEAVGYEHPYKVELDMYLPPVRLLDPETGTHGIPPPVEETKLTYIDTDTQLNELVQHLYTVNEIAVDVEHHSYRTYQGITCLIQISTNDGGDFIIDALAIREHIHKLNEAFTDPKKIKIFHGAENDVIWLQRDFGVYIVGLFDTHKAAMALRLPGLSLKHLLFKYCNVKADKKNQLADWRIRPLPDELIEYARMDTHYLIYIWRQMKDELLEMAAGLPNQLLSVFEQSRQLCGITYNKEVVHETSHMPLYIRSRKSFNSQQMAALKMLYKWRDSQARTLDESATYLLPNHMLLSLAENLPREVQGVNACCSPMPPFVKQNLITMHRMLLSCRELPAEPQLFQMPTSIRSMMNVTHQPLAYNVHDYSQLPDFSEAAINLDLAHAFLEEFDFHFRTRFRPEIRAFLPPHIKFASDFVSALNANAKLFIPPFDRYRKYRSLAQVEEIKEFKEKEAKIAALGKGNELIKEEVLVKLQKAKTQIEKETTTKTETEAKTNTETVAKANTKIEATDKTEKEEADNTAQKSESNEVEDDSQKKAAQRKRKINEKMKQKDVVDTTENKNNDSSQKNSKQVDSDVKPFFYKNVNYKKFYSYTEKGHEQPKMKFKKP